MEARDRFGVAFGRGKVAVEAKDAAAGSRGHEKEGRKYRWVGGHARALERHAGRDFQGLHRFEARHGGVDRPKRPRLLRSR